ncbi:hypothetical protein GCWU000322_00094 [Eubacterium saphenum ATCC 49989]|nr:hypothetical protein GCWU000322_00094 [Eubacterium saphenum ATCC 49989]
MDEKKMTPQARYEKKNVTRYTLKLNKNTDSDILKWLATQPNKHGAIKAAIRLAIRQEM